MKFLADGMLGKLARWLRMLGLDVEYSADTDDRTLIAKAKEERATILTRDIELYKNGVTKGLDAFFVNGRLEEDQLAELAERFGINLEIDMTTSRCPKCNTQVTIATKEEVADKVKRNTLENYDDFWRCPNCGQVYWQGAHWARIRNTLENARRKKNEKRLEEDEDPAKQP